MPLRHYATEVYGFNQGQIAIDNLIGNFSNVSQSLVVSWLRERKTDRNTWDALTSSQQQKDIIHSAMALKARCDSAANSTEQYLAAIQLFRSVGLEPDLQTSEEVNGRLRANQDWRDWYPMLDHALIRLQVGRGVLVALVISDGQGRREPHAIGIYRGDGDHLYVFDPNFGVFDVFNSYGFFAEWVKECTLRSFGLTPNIELNVRQGVFLYTM